LEIIPKPPTIEKEVSEKIINKSKNIGKYYAEKEKTYY